MGRVTAGSIARVLRLEADEGLLAVAQRNLAALNTVAALECAAVQRTPNLGAAAVAYCFSQGLKDAAGRGDAAAAVLAACRATPTLRLVVVVHDAREKKHALVAFAESEGGALREHPHVLGRRVVAWDRSTLVPLLPCLCPARTGGARAPPAPKSQI